MTGKNDSLRRKLGEHSLVDAFDNGVKIPALEVCSSGPTREKGVT